MSITAEQELAPLILVDEVKETLPEPAPEPEPVNWRVEVGEWDVVKIYEVIESDTGMLNGRNLETEPLIGQVTRAYTKGRPRTYPLVEAWLPHYGSYRLTAKRWELVEKRQTEPVSKGDWVIPLAGVNLQEYWHRYALSEPHEVRRFDKYGPSVNIMATRTDDGRNTEFGLMSWKVIPDASSDRPAAQIGTKIRVKKLYPERMMTDGTIGDGIGVVCRVRKDKTNGRVQALFKSANGDYVVRPVHSWEIIPFDSDKDELECFKLGLWKMTMFYGEENGLCPVMTTALKEAGVLPEQKVKVTLEIDLLQGSDLRNAPTLATLSREKVLEFLRHNSEDVIAGLDFAPLNNNA